MQVAQFKFPVSTADGSASEPYLSFCRQLLLQPLSTGVRADTLVVVYWRWGGRSGLGADVKTAADALQLVQFLRDLQPHSERPFSACQ